MSVRRGTRSCRRGSVAVEMAFLLPLIVFLCVIGVDFARIFSRTAILESASRNACYWAAQDPVRAANTSGIEAVAMRDLTDISPSPTVKSRVYTGADGFQYVEVTVEMTFNTITDFPGVPYSSKLSRKTEMRVCPTTPKAGTF
jgi:Flp pilus assembly protein TadG